MWGEVRWGEGLHEDRLSEQEGGDEGDGGDGGGVGSVWAGHGVDIAQVAVTETILLRVAFWLSASLVGVTGHCFIVGREVHQVRAVPLIYFSPDAPQPTEGFPVRTGFLPNIQRPPRDDRSAVQTWALENIKYFYQHRDLHMVTSPPRNPKAPPHTKGIVWLSVFSVRLTSSHS